MAGLKDVAKRAGVSVRTVSNVVNGYAPVSAERRARVEAAVRELGYKPNVLARGLRRGRSALIALVVPEIDVPYFAELAREVIVEAKLRGYTVVIDQTDGDPAHEREFLTSEKRAGLFDGIILSPLALSPAEVGEHSSDRPLVLLGERMESVGTDHVCIDNVAAAEANTAHLLQLARGRVAAIGDQPYDGGETAQQRMKGYRRAHERAGRAVDETLVVPCRRFHRQDGERAMHALLDHPDGPPDAVFCFSDLLALGAMRALQRRGLRIPDDVAVTGFDDIEDGRFHTPSLTTIAPDKAAIAQRAVASVVDRIEGRGDRAGREIFVPFQLIARESTIGLDLSGRQSTTASYAYDHRSSEPGH